ncbi:zinc-dependent peptidase, partial [Aquisphaera insulae]|uniref:zinc-dependent peptidase n=1 Tax=Aquisphaera insulae TaxID=2712864 RepID=UPI0013EBDC05
GEPTPPYEPTTQYQAREIEGWTVLVNKGLLAGQPDLADRTLALLGHQLFQVAWRVPPGPLAKLRTMHIWVEETSQNPCMTYHPSVDWLREHGMNPEKARCVELANARNFLKWAEDQPWMVLHELAHGYHDQFIEGGFENPDIHAAFRHAKAAGLFESVLTATGRQGQAYAARNPKEYFAESSEAFFGTNDFYPFVRPELRKHDPGMAELLQRLWELPRADR